MAYIARDHLDDILDDEFPSTWKFSDPFKAKMRYVAEKAYEDGQKCLYLPPSRYDVGPYHVGEFPPAWPRTPVDRRVGQKDRRIKWATLAWYNAPFSGSSRSSIFKSDDITWRPDRRAIAPDRRKEGIGNAVSL
jgi:hypothetical protein